MRPIDGIRTRVYTGRMATTSELTRPRPFGGGETNTAYSVRQPRVRSTYSGTSPGDDRKDYWMDIRRNLSEGSVRDAADWYSDMRLRRRLGSWDALDLMRPAMDLPRAVKPLNPSMGSRRASALRHGFVPGSPASRAARAMDLTHLGHDRKSWGTVVYVEGPKSTRKAPVRKASPAPKRPDASGGRPVVLSDHDLMAQLGIRAVGYLD